jgi:DNA-binding YbaB/EbfC family protein
MKDLGSLMKQAQAMQEKLQEAQAKLAETVVEGASGGGMVKLTLRGSGELKSVEIDPELLKPEDAEMVSDLIVAAHADAKRKLDAAQAETMKAVAGPLAGMPGFPKF